MLTDVWKSTNSGEDWQCLTANMAHDLTEQHSRGLGRLTTGVMAHDDTIFLIAGAKPNTTLSLNTVWTSYAADADSTAPTVVTAMSTPWSSDADTATGVLTTAATVILTAMAGATTTITRSR